MFVPVTPPQPSQEARELGRKMAELVRIFREGYPNLSFTEVRQAMRVAESELGSEFRGAGARMTVAIALTVAALMVGVFTFLLFSQPDGLPPYALMVVIIGLLVVGLAAVAAVRRR
jgi:hypothetical protein